MVDGARVELRGGQVAIQRVDGVDCVEKIEGRQRLRQREVRVEKRTHRADVLPVTFENMGKQFFLTEESRDDLLAEIRLRPAERVRQHRPVENVDTHRRETAFFRGRGCQFGLQGRAECQALNHLGILGLLDETRDRVIILDLHQAETCHLRNRKRHRRHSHVRLCGDVLLNDLAVVHPVELVARKNQHEIMREGAEVHEIAAHRIGGALIPIGALLGLLRRKNIHKAAAERIEVVRVLHVAVQ